MPRGHNDLTATVDARIQRICACAEHSQGNQDHQHKASADPVAACAKNQTQRADDGSGNCRKRRVDSDDQEHSNSGADRSYPIARRPLPQG